MTNSNQFDNKDDIVNENGGKKATGLGNWVNMITRPGPKLSQRILYAGIWAFALRLSLRLLFTARVIILARLLAPQDFGLMGIVLVVTYLLEVLAQTGFKAALIQKKDDITSYLHTAWTLELIRAIALAGILALAAPLAADFFSTPSATLLIRVMAIAVLLRGFRSIAVIYFERDLELQKRFIYEGTTRLAEVAVAIVLAFLLKSVWALVYGALAGAAVAVITSYILTPYMPRLRFELSKARELYSFGMWIFGADVLTYTRSHLPDIIIGRWVDVAGLGFYRMSINLSQIMSREIIGVAKQVAFPAYSMIQDQRRLLQKAYLESVQMVSLITFPASIGMLVLAPNVVSVVLGEQWLPMVPTLRILSVWGLLTSLMGLIQPLFRGIGRPDVPTKLHFFNLIVMAGMIYPMTTAWGLVGAALAVLASTAIVYPISAWLALKVIECPIRLHLKALFLPTLTTTSMSAAVYFASDFTGASQSSFWSLAWLTALGAITYLGTTLLFDKLLGYGLVKSLRKRAYAIRGRKATPQAESVSA
jgi:lipopolysaccharide exporter